MILKKLFKKFEVKTTFKSFLFIRDSLSYEINSTIKSVDPNLNLF